MPQKFQNLKKGHNFKKSSSQWLLRQVNDPYVEKSKQLGYRSRASFKIIEIDEKFKIFKKNKVVLDLGCSPGGWSQYAVSKVGDGNVLAIDLLEMQAIAGVKFLQQDFLAKDAIGKIKSELLKINNNHSDGCDIVLSDMASNTTGDKTTDHFRIIDLLEEALQLSLQILKNNGCFIGKIFQGNDADKIIQQLKKNFQLVKYFKPDSSRKQSSECYLVATGFKRINE